MVCALSEPCTENIKALESGFQCSYVPPPPSEPVTYSTIRLGQFDGHCRRPSPFVSCSVFKAQTPSGAPVFPFCVSGVSLSVSCAVSFRHPQTPQRSIEHSELRDPDSFALRPCVFVGHGQPSPRTPCTSWPPRPMARCTSSGAPLRRLRAQARARGGHVPPLADCCQVPQQLVPTCLGVLGFPAKIDCRKKLVPLF